MNDISGEELDFNFIINVIFHSVNIFNCDKGESVIRVVFENQKINFFFHRSEMINQIINTVVIIVLIISQNISEHNGNVKVI